MAIGAFVDLSGKVFGKWTVVKKSENRTNGGVILWECKCQCGNTALVTSGSLKSGNSRSCGCLQKEINIKRSTKHGLSYSRLYKIYNDMKQRCLNPNNHRYQYYGARGIAICDEWKSDGEVFFEWALNNGYSDELSIDRIDVNGDYEPKNCRWVTSEVQSNNKRVNRYITINDVTKTASQWAKDSGIHRQTFLSRVYSGWTGEKLLSKPNELSEEKK